MPLGSRYIGGMGKQVAYPGRYKKRDWISHGGGGALRSKYISIVFVSAPLRFCLSRIWLRLGPKRGYNDSATVHDTRLEAASRAAPFELALYETSLRKPVMGFSDELKLVVRRRAHFMCCLCHLAYVEVHHIIPEAEGGPNTESNAAPLCPACHDMFGADPKKRKYIRQARDLWYEVCEKRYASDPDCLEEIAMRLRHVPTKKDLNEAVKRVTNLLTAVAMNSRTSTIEAAQELSDLTGNFSEALRQWSRCLRCGYKWQAKERERVCPMCKSPYWDEPRRQG